MSKTKKLSVKTYMALFELYENGYSIEGALERLKIYFSPIRLKTDYQKYKKHGLDVLLPKVKNGTYSNEFNLNIVYEHLHEGRSLNELLVKYNIPSTSTLSRWISQHLSGKILSTYSPESEVYQMKYQSLSYQERVEIVDYYMNHTQSYKETAHHFKINYSQVYNWIKKFKKYGYDGLKDGRSKGKPQTTLTPEEALRAENKILKERNKFLQMEVDVLKKEEAIERELMKQALDKKHHTKR